MSFPSSVRSLPKTVDARPCKVDQGLLNNPVVNIVEVPCPPLPGGCLRGLPVLDKTGCSDAFLEAGRDGFLLGIGDTVREGRAEVKGELKEVLELPLVGIVESNGSSKAGSNRRFLGRIVEADVVELADGGR